MGRGLQLARARRDVVRPAVVAIRIEVSPRRRRLQNRPDRRIERGRPSGSTASRWSARAHPNPHHRTGSGSWRRTRGGGGGGGAPPPRPRATGPGLPPRDATRRTPGPDRAGRRPPRARDVPATARGASRGAAPARRRRDRSDPQAPGRRGVRRGAHRSAPSHASTNGGSGCRTRSSSRRRRRCTPSRADRSGRRLRSRDRRSRHDRRRRRGRPRSPRADRRVPSARTGDRSGRDIVGRRR
jgi:hypothetical protein